MIWVEKYQLNVAVEEYPLNVSVQLMEFQWEQSVYFRNQKMYDFGDD